jgi:uncharacterized coiled-coil protein SlyX
MDLAKLTTSLSQYSIERVEHQSKLVELDHLVGQLLNVNESLVQQLSARTANTSRNARYAIVPPPSAYANDTKSSTTKSKVIKKKIPRVATMGTVSSQSRLEETSRTMRSSSASRARIEEEQINAERLRGMHQMYVNIAKNVLGENSLKSEPVTSRRRSSSAGKKKDTAMKQRIEKVKKSKKVDDSTYALDNFECKYGIALNGNAHTSYDSLDNSFTRELFDTKISSDDNDHTRVSSEEFKSLIASLEEEFAELNNQYHSILSSSDSQRQNGEKTSEQLVSVIQKLHKKGEQLRALKSPQKRDDI